MSKKMSRMAARSGKDSSAMSSNSEMERYVDLNDVLQYQIYLTTKSRELKYLKHAPFLRLMI
jgi:hypothetical protein